jgi:uncharacterized protein (TIGR00251 family)
MSATADVFDVVEGGIVVRVHAQPGAGRSVIMGRHGDALKVKVAAPPVDGRANAALAEVLAEALGVKLAQVVLVSGASSRSKRYRITGVDADAARVGLAPPSTPGGAALNRQPRRP